MIKLIAKKLLRLFFILIAVTAITFFMVNLLPGDAAYNIAGPDSTAEEIENIRKDLGLNENVVVRYLNWLFKVVKGDLGESLLARGLVSRAIVSRLPVTIELLVLSVLLSLMLAIPFGVICAYKPGSLIDKAVSSTAFGMMAVPVFVMGIALIYIFSIHLRWLPATGFSPISAGIFANIKSLLLPAFTIAMVEWVPLMRVLRSDMITTLQENYILMARSKGLPAPYILFRHALQPSSLTLITILGLQIGHLFGGSMIVETIFALPGIGRLLIGSIFGRDYAMVQGCILFTTIAYVIVNFAVDMLYAFLDPRIRKQMVDGHG
ncbi:MAG: ABC transporter permease [Desulfobacteraceae bacterium]|nr:ABC transporter permease [Desulfobacteraceae bacterium]